MIWSALGPVEVLPCRHQVLGGAHVEAWRSRGLIQQRLEADLPNQAGVVRACLSTFLWRRYIHVITRRLTLLATHRPVALGWPCGCMQLL